MSTTWLNKYIETCRSNLEDEAACEEMTDFLDHAKNLIPVLEKNPANFFSLFAALIREVKEQQKIYAQMRTENQKLGWTFSSKSAHINYDNKIEQFNNLLGVFEQIYAEAKESKLSQGKIPETEVQPPFIGRR